MSEFNKSVSLAQLETVSTSKANEKAVNGGVYNGMPPSPRPHADSATEALSDNAWAVSSKQKKKRKKAGSKAGSWGSIEDDF